MSTASSNSDSSHVGSQIDTETLLRNIGRFPSQVVPFAVLKELQSRGAAIHDSLVALISKELEWNESPLGSSSNASFFAFALLPPIVTQEDQPLIESLLSTSFHRIDGVIGDLSGEAMPRLIANFFQSQSAEEVFGWIDRILSKPSMEELTCHPLVRALTIAVAMSWLDRSEAIPFLVEQLKKRSKKQNDLVSAFIVSELMDLSARSFEEVDSLVVECFTRRQIDESYIHLDNWENEIESVIDRSTEVATAWDDCAEELAKWCYDFTTDDFDPVSATYRANPCGSSNSKGSESQARILVEQLRGASSNSYPRDAVATLEREFPVAYQAIVELIRDELSRTQPDSNGECGRGAYLALVLLVKESMPLPQDLVQTILRLPDSRLDQMFGHQFDLVVKCIAQSPIQDVGILEQWIWDPDRSDANRRAMVSYYSYACYRYALEREVAIEALAKGLRKALTQAPSLIGPFAENLAFLTPTEHALLLEEAFEGSDVEWEIAKDDLRHMMVDVRVAKEVFEEHFQIHQSIEEIVSAGEMFDIAAIREKPAAPPVSHRTVQRPTGLELTQPSFSVTGTIRNEERTSRNSSCPCGSGKKFKKCCMRK